MLVYQPKKLKIENSSINTNTDIEDLIYRKRLKIIYKKFILSVFIIVAS